MQSPAPSRVSEPSSLANLSIYQLARLHCRERLLVDPLEWTDRHISLLQCSFENPTSGLSKVPREANDTESNGETGSGYVRSLFSRDSYGWRNRMMRNILASPECPFVPLDDLYFYFNERYIKTLPCVVFYLGNNRSAAANGHVPPVVAFVDHLPAYRGRSKQHSEATNALYRIRWKQLTPVEPLHDPYIVALLIAIAYQQRHVLRQQENEANSSTFLAQVLLTKVSSSFLQKLDLPAHPHPTTPSPSISIRHTVISRTPYATFRKRIVELLLPAPTHKMLNNEHEYIKKQLDK
ncbi:hypothetical protein F5884DRAFT_819611 [Xylogone sp. PMI_703]|nr:hypothetical protein F5884DRAFT_819611 [Xylogone sp. PMI_703]